MQMGGQLTTTTDVENWPGDSSVLGPDLMVRMEAHAKSVGDDCTNYYIYDGHILKKLLMINMDYISQRSPLMKSIIFNL